MQTERNIRRQASPGRLRPLAFRLGRLLLLVLLSPEQVLGQVPGTIISHSPASSGIYVGSPTLADLPDGSYVASHDEFGPKSTEFAQAFTPVFRSGDQGGNRQHFSTIHVQEGGAHNQHDANFLTFHRVKDFRRLTMADSVAGSGAELSAVGDSSPLHEKAAYLQRDLLEKHWLDGLYVSIVPAAAKGTQLPHTVNQPGNVIHAGVWTGRYLAGVGYQYAMTENPWVRQHGGEILHALRILQEVTGKPGLLARGYVQGHGPVEGWERDGQDSPEWHQGQGNYADYRWYGDVSVDNFNAVLYGYAIYYDLGADAAQRQLIAEDVDRLMTHLLENHCRIIDVDGEVTLWGHVGIDPDPAWDEYYQKLYATRFNRGNATEGPWAPSLRSSLMLLPNLLIAHHITGQKHRISDSGRSSPSMSSAAWTKRED